MHHLRTGTTREWSDFPLIAKDSQLIIHFDIEDESGPATIRLRQYDVSQSWQIMSIPWVI
jgi:hypothetical protein